jgi:hypothetical protein
MAWIEEMRALVSRAGAALMALADALGWRTRDWLRLAEWAWPHSAHLSRQWQDLQHINVQWSAVMMTCWVRPSESRTVTA